MSDWNDMLKNLVPALGNMGVDMLVDEFNKLSAEAAEPWKKSILALLGDALKKNGTDGIKMAYDAIEALIHDEEPKIDWADLEVASNVLAQMQNAEADHKTKAAEFFALISNDIGRILGALIQGIIASV